MTQETELPALPEPRRYGLLRPDGSIDESLIGSRADCEYWTRAEKEEQSGWEIVGIYTEHDMRAAVLAERERQQSPHMRRLTGLWRFGREVLPVANISFEAFLSQLDGFINEKTQAHPLTPPAVKEG